MEKYEAPVMEVVELEGSIVTIGLPQIPGNHGASGNQSASC